MEVPLSESEIVRIASLLADDSTAVKLKEQIYGHLGLPLAELHELKTRVFLDNSASYGFFTALLSSYRSMNGSKATVNSLIKHFQFLKLGRIVESLEDLVRAPGAGLTPKPPNPNPNVALDFAIGYNHVPKITNVMAEDPVLLNDWTDIVHGFLDNAQDLFEIEHSTPGKITNKIRRTLQLWISRRAEEATFTNLLKIMENSKCNKTAGMLNNIMDELKTT